MCCGDHCDRLARPGGQIPLRATQRGGRTFAHVWLTSNWTTSTHSRASRDAGGQQRSGTCCEAEWRLSLEPWAAQTGRSEHETQVGVIPAFVREKQRTFTKNPLLIKKSAIHRSIWPRAHTRTKETKVVSPTFGIMEQYCSTHSARGSPLIAALCNEMLKQENQRQHAFTSGVLLRP